MKPQTAIIVFSQSEKIKSGLIWASQIVQLLDGFAGAEKMGAVKTARALMEMISHEVVLVQNVSRDPEWPEIRKDLDTAGVMVDSGVPMEAVHHLTQALSKSTSVANRSMTFLKDTGFL